MKPGPPKKPAALEWLQGNPSHRPLNTSAPPVPIPANTPHAPDFLNEYGKKEWRRLVKVLMKVGLYSVVDRAALAMYCQAYGRWIAAEIALSQEIEEAGIVEALTRQSSKGYNYMNPMLSIANTAWEQIRKMLGEFGLTPATRQALIFEPSDEPDQLEMLFFRRRVALMGDDDS